MRQSINLLPWRETRRLKQRRTFFNHMGAAAVSVAILLGGASWYANVQIERQEARNARIQQEITTLNQTLQRFSKRAVEREELQRRLMLVNSLQQQRNNSILLFNLLPEITPEGVVLDDVSLKAGKVTLRGRSRSNAQLATLLALLETHKGATHVQMHSIVNNASEDQMVAKQFSATFELVGFILPSLPIEAKKNG
ncbi:pilus assembly protein PilN [Enterovibrio norvegicus]|uniref:Type IV pilus assembly protein PilN n=1 Tax=Enterovibrio norvegicus DSM 15893 TaxID=1121869 RepID=A0A1I5PAF2_9GAMM|nr:PilN domain-containing protein [Enterovibrio norvegicus]OEE45713.1 pilus assembly protein PilN [Enterovibrio norvegicus]PMI35459.1 pilus assembly protein PilN [Enterovibrio norvegicus]PMI38137.1 pilus assembly protein PilN [Enterovibrio norvegicus]PMN55514.1 pilus assembly protein PilN [Enterovibrio norvegicus]TKF18164.1 pilus assembly protein PilN [Enterovibrio norvegicus]